MSSERLKTEHASRLITAALEREFSPPSDWPLMSTRELIDDLAKGK